MLGEIPVECKFPNWAGLDLFLNWFSVFYCGNGVWIILFNYYGVTSSMGPLKCPNENYKSNIRSSFSNNDVLSFLFANLFRTRA